MNTVKNNMTRKKCTKKLVSFLAIFVLLLGCAGCRKQTPQEVVDNAFNKTFSGTSPIEKLLGSTEIQNAINKNTPYSFGSSITLQSLSGSAFGSYAALLSGLGFSYDSATDVANKKLQADIGVSYGGTTYLTAGVQADGSKLYLSVPQLLNGCLSVNLATLKEDLSSNDLFTQAFASSGLTIPDDLSFDIWNLFSADTTVDFSLPKDVQSAYDAMMKKVVTEKVNDADAVTLPDGVSAKNIYTMTLTKEAYKDFAEAITNYVFDIFLEQLNEQASAGLDITNIEIPDAAEIRTFVEELTNTIGDLVLTVAVTKDGYVNCLASDINIEGNTLAFSVVFSGKNSPLEEIDAKVSAKIDGEKLALDYTQKFDSDKKTLSYKGGISFDDFSARISAEGQYSNVEKGKKYTFDLNFFEFTCSEDIAFTLSARSYMDITKCEIGTPSATQYEILKMDENALMGLLTEVMTKLQSDPLLSGLLGGMLN